MGLALAREALLCVKYGLLPAGKLQSYRCQGTPRRLRSAGGGSLTTRYSSAWESS